MLRAGFLDSEGHRRSNLSVRSLSRPACDPSVPSRSKRFLAALALIALVLVGRIAESIHSAQSGHVICPEHGEMLHVAAANDADLAPDSTPTQGPRVRPSGAHGEHEHCLLVNLLWSSGASWCAEESVPHLFDPKIVDGARSARETRFALAVLCFAPKHSPPARTI